MWKYVLFGNFSTNREIKHEKYTQYSYHDHRHNLQSLLNAGFNQQNPQL